MNTPFATDGPYEYDPLDGLKERVLRDRKVAAIQLMRAQQLQDAARAVIAAGRPDSWDHSNKKCKCQSCTAYDALAALLKEP